MTGFDSKRQSAMDKLVEIQEELGMYDDQKPAQEPVAWGYRSNDGEIYDCISPEAHEYAKGDYTVPLYTAPQQRPWVGLTDEEISATSKGHIVRNTFARAIEAKLKEKNT